MGKRKTHAKEEPGWLWPLSACAVAATAVLAFFAVLYGWDHDAGAFLWTASKIAQGNRPYLDFWNIYLPLLHVLNAIPIWLRVPPVIIVHLIPCFWLAAVSVATYRLARSWEATPAVSLFLVAVGLVFFVDNGGDHVTLEYGVVVFAALSIELLRSAGRDSRMWIASGACASLSILSKQVGVIGVVPIAALAAERWKEPGFKKQARDWIIGLAIPWIVFLAWMSFDFRGLYDGWVRYFLFYGDASPSLDLSPIGRELTRTPITVALLCASVAACAWRGFRETSWERRIFWAASLGAIVLLLVPRLYRDYPHYNLNTWPFLVIALSAPLPRAPKWLMPRWRLPVAAVALGAVLTWAYADRLWFSWRSSYFHRWDPPGYIYGLYEPVARKVRELQPEGSYILIIGDEPILEFLSGMTTPGILRHDVLFDPAQDKGFLTLLVDHGQPGVAEQRAKLAASGYVTVPHEGSHPEQKIEIWVKARR